MAGRKGAVPNLALQVKTALGLDKDGCVEARAEQRASALREEPGFLYVIVLAAEAAVEVAWVIPSAEFNRLAYRHELRGGWVELQLRARPAGDDAWSRFRCAPGEVGRRLLAHAEGAPEVSEEALALRLVDLAGGRPGHFRFESGLHGDLWLELDALLADPVAVAPVVDALARRMGRFEAPAAVCGAITGGAFLAQLVAARLGVEFLFTEQVAGAGAEGLFAMRYRLPAVLAARARGRRVAVVNDVTSGGSAVRGTVAALEAAGADVVGVATVLLLGEAFAAHAAGRGLGVEALAARPHNLWEPGACPLCAAGAPLETPSYGPAAPG